jgi:predicted nucleic acid-binding protein
MDRLFLDANVLFSAAYKIDAHLRQLWKFQQVRLCSSNYALAEARINLADEDQRNRLRELSSSLELFEASRTQLPPEIFLPEKDAPIFLAAVEARATHLLTGDVRHFNYYFGKTIAGVAITRPAEYIGGRRRAG